MEWIHQFVDLFLHLDRHLNDAMQAHGTTWTYVVLFAIIFSETGFVVTPFLPGDSLLFAAGALGGTPGGPVSVGVGGDTGEPDECGVVVRAVLRGGHWGEHGELFCRAAVRRQAGGEVPRNH